MDKSKQTHRTPSQEPNLRQIFTQSRIMREILFRALLEELEDLLDNRELDEDLTLLVGTVAHKMIQTEDESEPPVTPLHEVKRMLVKNAETWPQRWKDEGLERGFQLGKKAMVEYLTSYRFGDLPQWAVERLRSADQETLDYLSQRLFEARHLEELFNEEVQ